MKTPTFHPHDMDAVPFVGLSEARKADRTSGAWLLVRLAESHGATATAREEDERRRVVVTINAPGGLALSVALDGLHGARMLDTYIVPWHIDLDAPGVKLARSFGDVNPHHQQKATHVARGFEALYREVHRGLGLAASGAAYEATP